MTSCKPELENKVSDLQNSIYLLKQKVDLLIHELPKLSPAEEGDFGAFASAHLGAATAAAVAGTSGPNGRGDDLSHRSAGAGVVTTLVPPPVIGAGRFTNLTPIPFKVSILLGLFSVLVWVVLFHMLISLSSTVVILRFGLRNVRVTLTFIMFLPSIGSS